ncbi:biotin--[acetyl-CoA-carboxylase] ligase [bacterium]|nr:biotin--[acetyl-CoA-carboxylase] ligase [bacterium]
MDNNQFQSLLNNLHPGKTAFFSSTTSTNDIGAEWVQKGVPDFSIIAADEQTKGRGRSGRRWHTNPDSALAFSIILKPQIDQAYFSRYTALGAIGVCQAISQISDTPALIKWPNDVLISNRKVAGILTEMIWKGDHPEAVIIGIGVNITHESLPSEKHLNFPAGFLAASTPEPPDRYQVLYAILSAIKTWRQQITSDAFIKKWERLLAFRNREIEVLLSVPGIEDNRQPPDKISGQLIGIDPNGLLLVKISGGEIKSFTANEIKILPTE